MRKIAAAIFLAFLFGASKAHAHHHVSVNFNGKFNCAPEILEDFGWDEQPDPHSTWTFKGRQVTIVENVEGEVYRQKSKFRFKDFRFIVFKGGWYSGKYQVGFTYENRRRILILSQPQIPWLRTRCVEKL